MKRSIQFRILLVIFLFSFYSCNNENAENFEQLSPASTDKENWGDNSKKSIEENKKEFSNLFDEMTEFSLIALSADNKRLKVPDLVKFEQKTLEEIRILLSDIKGVENIGSGHALNYVDQFKSQRDSLLSQDNFSKKENYVNATNSIISEKSPFSKNIMREGENYEVLVIKIEELISKSHANFNIISPEPVKEDYTSNIEQQEASQSTFSLNTLTYILLAIILLSFVYNFIQHSRISKLKKKYERFKMNANSQPKTAQQSIPRAAAQLSQVRAKSIFESTYSIMISSLNSDYSSACVETSNVEMFKHSILEEMANRNFASEIEAKSFIDQKLRVIKETIINKIDDCRDRSSAEGIADNELEYNQFRNSKLEDDENRSIVNRHISNFKNSLGITIDARELDLKIETAREIILQDISKTIQKNSEYYISFFDTDGTIADSKKSKVPKRDSVVKFVIDADDPTRATYTMLYEDSVMMKSGIQSYQGLLLPICKIEGAVDPNGTGIVQVGEDGTLELSNGYWKVDEKLTVKII